MRLRNFLETALTIVMVIAALAVSTVMVRREFFPHPIVDYAHGASGKPVPVADWAQYATVGHRQGPANAPVTIVEFADFECPFCGRFANETLPAVLAKYPGKVAVVFRHFPLTGHRFAYPTARAAECAASQGTFKSFEMLAFRKQDSLGLKSYHDFAKDAGVPDLAAFDTCNGSAEPVPAIETDKLAARKLGANGTPTLIINGNRYDSALPAEMVDSLIDAALAARR